MRGYGVDLRVRVVRAVQGGMAQGEAARVYGISVATVERYVRLAREGRSLEVQKNPGSPPRVIAPEQHGLLLAQLQAHPDLTHAEHAALWSRRHGAVSVATVERRIKTLGWTRKKNTGMQRTR